MPEAVWGTSCGGGNPFALGRPLPGQSVADIGCGAGFDVCIAAGLVGGGGSVLGVDVNSAMLGRARANVAATRDLSKSFANVTFVEAGFDNPMREPLLPHFEKYDTVISNGALCLSFNKPEALATAFALLRPGGKFLLFDLFKVDGTVPADMGQKTQKS